MENEEEGLQPLNVEEARVIDEEARTVQGRFVEFLKGFSLGDLMRFEVNGWDEDEEDGNTVGLGSEVVLDAEAVTLYAEQIAFMKAGENSTLQVNFQHVVNKDMVLAEAIKEEYYRYAPYLNKSVQIFVHGVDPDFADGNSGEREFYVSFYQVESVDRIRSLRTDSIGKLMSISGTVTRTSEVRPELVFATFQCTKCGRKIEDVEQQFKFTEPMLCTDNSCKNTTKWHLLHEEGKFADWQKLRVQENSNEVPAGSMPRSMDIVVRHEAVEKAKPGDKCIFVGTLIAIPDVSKLKTGADGPGLLMAPRGRRSKEEQGQGVTGIKALGVRDMNYRLTFLACSIQGINARFSGANNMPGGCGASTAVASTGRNGQQNRLNKRQRLNQERQRYSALESQEEETKESIRAEFSTEDLEDLRLMARQSNLLVKMRRSVAPAVFGHENIKLGILLMLFGGVHKKTPDGTKLRGDINVCVVGDPSTAKSQFLKYVCGFLPRAVYTSGKASSAAGLTASVVKDPESGEYCVEAGALMLADNGICCIDEFDKMDDVDQVAIHEAMEQQTISITKAGIQATLNARTSILAAANPINGRYDRTKGLQKNLQLSPAIMSRFDLFFVVLDECDESQDRVIAEHIIRVHRKRIQLLCEGHDPEELEEEDGTASSFLNRDDNNNNAMEQDDEDEDEDDPASQLEAARNHIFSTAQLQSYIRFARTIDPILPPAVQPKLVECYRKLRQGDLNVAGQSNQAYRITVRQLEALVRLAEALARLHLDEEVRPRYVDWAYHLLKTSIVQVESGDIVVDDVQGDTHNASALTRLSQQNNSQGNNEDDSDSSSDSSDSSSDSDGNDSDNSDNGDGNANPAMNRDGGDGGEKNDENADSNTREPQQSPSRQRKNAKKNKNNKNKSTKRLRKQKNLSVERYTEITNMIVTFTRQREDATRAAGKRVAVRQRDLVLFYLETLEVGNMEELTEERKLINNIIQRLVDVDNALIVPMDLGEGKGNEKEEEEFEESEVFPMESRWLSAHPNFVCS